MRIQVVTCDSLYDKNGKYVDGSHEIHEIDNLKHIDHIKATLNSIIVNHLLYMEEDMVLDMIIISGNETETIDTLIEYCKEYHVGVEIASAETAMYL